MKLQNCVDGRTPNPCRLTDFVLQLWSKMQSFGFWHQLAVIASKISQYKCLVPYPAFVVGPKTERRVRNDAIVLCKVLNSFSIGVVKFGTPCREKLLSLILHL